MKQVHGRALRVLIATDFNIAVFQKFGIDSELFFGGWIKTRVPYSPEQLSAEINKNQIDVLVVEVEDVPASVFEQCPSLAVVCSLRANPVNVDVKAAQEAGVTVLYTPGRNAQAVAELTIALILDILRNVSKSYGDMSKGIWGEKRDDPYLRFRGTEMAGKTVGLLGFGAIGQAVAQLLSGFNTHTIAHDKYQQGDVFERYKVAPVGMDELLGSSEILSIHLPLTPATCNLIGRKEIARIKPGLFLVNTARAHVVEKKALMDGLLSGRIAAAALDVHYEEPPKEDPLLLLPNVFYTPHIGGATKETILKGSDLVAANLVRWSKGEPVLYQAK